MGNHRNMERITHGRGKFMDNHEQPLRLPQQNTGRQIVKKVSHHEQDASHSTPALTNHPSIVDPSAQKEQESPTTETRRPTAEEPAQVRTQRADVTVKPIQHRAQRQADAPARSQRLKAEPIAELQQHKRPATEKKKPAKRHPPSWLLWVAFFLLGLLIGGGAVLTYVSAATDRPLLSFSTSNAKSAITITLDATYIGQLVEKQSSGSSKLNNVHVQIKKGQPLVITGDAQVPVLGTKPLMLTAQPYIQSCQVQIRVIHADIAGVPTQVFTSSVENEVNQQLKSVQAQLPSGFTYCATSVSTQTDEMVVSYSARAV
jgi:hypothetical protein